MHLDLSHSRNIDVTRLWSDLAQDGDRIVYLVMDGLGGISRPGSPSALQAARTPNLDRLVSESSCGMLEMVGPGITPGSGPGHLAMFGYDPLDFTIGRGVLSALGIDFPLRPGDVAARVNFATLDERGMVTDRRAGRISTSQNRELCQRIRENVKLDFSGEYFFETESGHRAVLVLRGDRLSDKLTDSDPQHTGAPPLQVQARENEAQYTAQLAQSFIDQACFALRNEAKANAILLRGFQSYEHFPTLHQRFGLSGLCVAQYPMYRGVSRLLGMEVAEAPRSNEHAFETLARHYQKDRDTHAHNFYFLHIKATDSCGEDGDLKGKITAVEEVDAMLPILLENQPDVLVITGDHATPPQMRAHSWHPVPVMINAAIANCDGINHFDEQNCRGGSLGMRPGVHLMGLALAHARRLNKFGA